SSDLLAQPVDHTSSCFSFFWGTLSPRGEGENRGATLKQFPTVFHISSIFLPTDLTKLVSFPEVFQDENV
ncbi:hypothetical protein, partial [Enterobacter cloacae]